MLEIIVSVALLFERMGLGGTTTGHAVCGQFRFAAVMRARRPASTVQGIVCVWGGEVRGYERGEVVVIVQLHAICE